MTGSRIERLVAVMAETISEDFGFELVKVSFTKERGRRYLRVFLDREGGIDLEVW